MRGEIREPRGGQVDFVDARKRAHERRSQPCARNGIEFVYENDVVDHDSIHELREEQRNIADRRVVGESVYARCRDRRRGERAQDAMFARDIMGGRQQRSERGAAQNEFARGRIGDAVRQVRMAVADPLELQRSLQAQPDAQHPCGDRRLVETDRVCSGRGHLSTAGASAAASEFLAQRFSSCCAMVRLCTSSGPSAMRMVRWCA
jgi:hypothetical protein